MGTKAIWTCRSGAWEYTTCDEGLSYLPAISGGEWTILLDAAEEKLVLGCYMEETGDDFQVVREVELPARFWSAYAISHEIYQMFVWLGTGENFRPTYPPPPGLPPDRVVLGDLCRLLGWAAAPGVRS